MLGDEDGDGDGRGESGERRDCIVYYSVYLHYIAWSDHESSLLSDSKFTVHTYLVSCHDVMLNGSTFEERRVHRKSLNGCHGPTADVVESWIQDSIPFLLVDCRKSEIRSLWNPDHEVRPQPRG